MLCEKPLTPDVSSSLESSKPEAERHARIQVGSMRRFDAEYTAAEGTDRRRRAGRAAGVHCAHRNPDVPPTSTTEMMINDSVVHEFDATRFLFNEEITSVQIIKPAANPAAPAGLQDPQIAIFETARG